MLELKGISKSFPGVKALDDVSFEVRAGEVHGLLGENGAGKSTILKIISGAQRPSAGEILWNGKPVHLDGPQDAQRLGIVTIYQEFNLIPTLTVAENIHIGRAPLRFGVVDWRRMMSDAHKAICRVGMDLDPSRIVSSLSVAQQQLVEIARALSIDARLIIMDEPTAALSQTEVQELLRIVRQLRSEGVAILFVTHRLEEVMEICDRITVLRDGRLVARRDIAEVDIPAIIDLMVGRAAADLYSRHGKARKPGDVVLGIRALSTARGNAWQRVPLHDISIDLRAGEILGLAGLVGAGRTELARAIFGADRFSTGQISIDGKPVSIRSPRNAIRHGIGLVPEDRKNQALFLQLAIRENFSVAAMSRYSRAGVFIDTRREDAELKRLCSAVRVRMTGPGQRVANLSGGNQQKVVIARWLALSPRVLIVDEPTRGIDIGAKSEVHDLLGQLADKGTAIMVISSELPEIMSISDRVITLSEGRITGEFTSDNLTEAALMERMTPRAVNREARVMEGASAA